MIKIFAALAVQFDPPVVARLLKNLVAPIYRAMEVDKAKEGSCAALATQAMALMRDRVTAPVFFAAYAGERERRAQIKDGRKRKSARMEVGEGGGGGC